MIRNIISCAEPKEISTQMINLLRSFDKIFVPQPVYAHCDVPCGIYKVEPSLTAAETVIKMVEKIEGLPKENPTVDDRNLFVRAVKVKEEHAELCKREILVLWTDFFKPEHLEKWPDLHEKVWKATKLCSENKRSVNMGKAQELLKAVTEIGEILEKAQVASNASGAAAKK